MLDQGVKMKFLVFFVVFTTLRQDVFSQNVLKVLGTNTNKIITQFKDFTPKDYEDYLSGLFKVDGIPVNQTLDFPKSLTSSNYTVTDGNVTRFYEPLRLHGSFDKIIFHQLNKEFFGITQVYGPKIEFSFKYTTNSNVSKKTGGFTLVVSHIPLELQIDLGDKVNDTCTVDTKANDVFYFYDKKLTLVPKFDPASDKNAGKELVDEISQSWLGQLYKVIMKVKVEKIAADTKHLILTDSTFRKDLEHVCKTVK